MIKLENASIDSRVQVERFTLSEKSCGVIGPNGAGKSSFLKMIAQLEDFQGSIICEGDVAYCGDATSLQSDMLASEVLFYARGNKAQNSDFLNHLIKHFNFTTLLNRPVSTLSGGEKQRLNIISIFYYDCDYTLLDEPTNYLDPIYVDLLSEFLKSWEKSLFIVSHNLNFVIDNCQQLLAFNDGCVSFDGKTSKALDDKAFDKVFLKEFNYQSFDERRYIL
ncbi:ATP-binding cassette domain-containing protein [Halobacteriovorax sp.]|uniref:ATP-binding cassette domain-containing protein n=1 Tax=Halobacteriovorax sp. TaxID=2020862 RepID=UPI003AF2CA28